MSYKKQIVTIMTLLVLILLMMSTTIQAVSVGKIYNVNATMNGSQMKLRWDAVSNAMGYTIYVNDTKIGSVYANEATLINFSDNTTYRFKIAAYDYSQKEVAISNEFKFTTTSYKTLAQVTNLSVTQSNGYVTLNWSPVNGASKYQIFVDVPGFGFMNIGDVTTTNAMLQGFKNGQRYGFCVRACQTLSSGNMNYGEKSNAQYCVIGINQENNRPGQVYGVNSYSITDKTATISWSKLNNVDGYEVLLSKNYGNYQKVLDTTKTSANLSNLTPNSYYRVAIIAYKWANGTKLYGTQSNYNAFNTKQEVVTVGKASNLNVNNVTKNSAYATWSSEGQITGYEIYLSKNYGSFQYLGITTLRNYNINNLKENTYYQVKVQPYRIVNGRKYTNNAITKGFTTLKSNNIITPSTVMNLNVQVRNRNEAYLAWLPADNATGYEVWVSKNGYDYEMMTYSNTTYTILTNSMLNYSTNYKVKVRAYKNQYVNGVYQSVYGNYSNVVSFRTENYNYIQDNPTIGKVENVYAPVSKDIVYLSWNPVSGAAGYEIDFNVPGIGSIEMESDTNYKTISGLTEKEYYYSARVRAYKYINGVKQYGLYSDIVRFTGK